LPEWQINPQTNNPYYIDNLAAYLETSWTQEVGTLQLQAPALTDTYYLNVYVANTEAGGPTISGNTYGYAWVFQPGDGIYPWDGIYGNTG